MKYLTLFPLLLLPLLTEAQIFCEQTLQCRIIAPSGMRMRAEPSLKAKVVTYVPYDSALTACREKFGTMQYEKISGYWRKVAYNGKQGYMFDGFLEIMSIQDKLPQDSSSIPTSADSVRTDSATVTASPVPTKSKKISYSLLTETYNYCGNVESIDPGLLWYGIYPKDEKNFGQHYRIKEVEVNVLLSRQKIGKGLEFDVLTDQEERSIFLIGINQPLPLRQNTIEDHSETLRLYKRKVFPGQQWKLSGEPASVTLSATGSVQTAGPCPQLKDYSLMLKGNKYFLPVEQDMTKALAENGRCGMPEIYWYGDLNEDQIPEIIFVSVYEEYNRFTLFVSDPALDDVLLKKEAQWTIDKCYE